MRGVGGERGGVGGEERVRGQVGGEGRGGGEGGVGVGGRRG